jgi:hypothetical protein
MKQTDSSIIIVRNLCVLTSASMIVYIFFTRSWSVTVEPKPFFTRSWSKNHRNKTTESLSISTTMARTVSCLISNVISTLKCRSVPVGFKLHSVVISYLIGHFLFFLVHRDRPFPVENLVIRKKPRVSKYLKYCYVSDIDRLHTSGFVIYRSNRFQ